MKLFYRKYGAGEPFLILHGLFGQSDNWNTLAKQFGGSDLEVYVVDMRNHGLSPHSEVWNYDVMADDILELADDLQLTRFTILGHSMGGMAAMNFACKYANRLNKLIVADIAPKPYPPHHDKVLAALLAVDFSKQKTRKEADNILSAYIPDEATKQFLLKNLFWKEDDLLAWRFNLEVIARNIEIISSTFSLPDIACPIPAWFIKGERSGYISNNDLPLIHHLFPVSTLVTIPNAGHWIHADQPVLFFEKIMEIIRG
jgi:esterase